MCSLATNKSKPLLSCYRGSVSARGAHPEHPPAAVRRRAQLDESAVSQIDGYIKKCPFFSDEGTDYISTIIIIKEKRKRAFGQQTPAEEQDGLNQ